MGVNIIFIYFSEAWRRRRPITGKRSKQHQEIRDQINPKLKTERDADLIPKFENDSEVEIGTEFENDPKIEAETEYQNDPKVEQETELKD